MAKGLKGGEVLFLYLTPPPPKKKEPKNYSHFCQKHYAYSLFCIGRELAGGGCVAVAVGIADIWQKSGKMWHLKKYITNFCVLMLGFLRAGEVGTLVLAMFSYVSVIFWFLNAKRKTKILFLLWFILLSSFHNFFTAFFSLSNPNGF